MHSSLAFHYDDSFQFTGLFGFRNNLKLSVARSLRCSTIRRAAFPYRYWIVTSPLLEGGSFSSGQDNGRMGAFSIAFDTIIVAPAK